MKIKLNKKIGKEVLQFEIEDKDIKDILMSAGQISGMPDYCPLCKSDFCQLESKKVKAKDTGDEYQYVYVRCKKCGAQSQMGEYKSGGIFWKQFEKFEKKGSKQEEELPIIQEDSIDESDIPF